MTILERKAEFIRQILTETDDSTFERLEQILKNQGTQRLPGQETVEEMRAGVRRALDDYKNGKNYTSQEELIARFGV